MTANDLVLTKLGIRFQNRLIPCSIGRGGITTDKREGDGATPAGKHRIMGLYYRPDRLPAPAPWAIPIRPFDLWSDDINDPAYNHLARVPHPFSHESLRRADPLYNMILITDWNWPRAIPGKGSAIFLHIWRKPHHPTEGCVAFSRTNLHRIIQHITPNETHLIIPDLCS
jgi:L,D-peptidoglycan transpeptidase YkuD (ErfK/YbiS/YcfS/YnhG family)